VIHLKITGGPFAPAVFEVHLAQDGTGTFYNNNGSEGEGVFNYSRIDGENGVLTLNYTNPGGGDKDILNLRFGPGAEISATGKQWVASPGGELVAYDNFSAEVFVWNDCADGSTGGWIGGTTGSTGGTTGGVTGGVTGAVTGGTDGQTTGDTAGTTGATTSGSTGGLTGGSTSGVILPPVFIKLQVVGGPYAPAVYEIQLSGGLSGSFVLANGSDGEGVYEFTPIDSATGNLTLIYGGASLGDQDLMVLHFNGTSQGYATGSQVLANPTGVTTYDNFSASILSVAFGAETTGGSTGATDAGTTAGNTDGGGTSGSTTAGTTGGADGGSTGAATGGSDSGTTGATTGGTTVSTSGYVNTTLKPGYNLIANPLRTADNRIGNLFKQLPEGSKVYKFDGADFAIATMTSGQLEPQSVAETEILPGEGLCVYNASSSDVLLTFAGQIALGPNVNHLPAGLSMRSSLLPKEGGPADLELPLEDGDQVFQYNPVTQRYTTWTYDSMIPNGPGFIPAGGPIFKVGEAFFIRKNHAADWIQNTVINP
jgi:hypothetical protein